MFFEGGHPVPVYTLANAAREIVTSIAHQTGIKTGTQEIADIMGMTTKDIIGPLVSTANFFKHADRDADAILVLDEDDVRFMLITASEHFKDVTNGWPLEATVFDVWAKALVPKVIAAQPPATH